jgi:hypothetical protein
VLVATDARAPHCTVTIFAAPLRGALAGQVRHACRHQSTTIRGVSPALWIAGDSGQGARNKTVAKRIFRRLPDTCARVPSKSVIDQPRSYPVIKTRNHEWADARHAFVKAGARVNNRAEARHRSTRERKRPMKGLKSPPLTQAFLSSLSMIHQHFAIKQGALDAARYRGQLARRFASWRLFTDNTKVCALRWNCHQEHAPSRESVVCTTQACHGHVHFGPLHLFHAMRNPAAWAWRLRWS